MPDKIPTHRTETQRMLADAYNRQAWRQEDAAFYRSRAWRTLRRSVLWDRPLCEDCRALDPPRLTPANEVHHEIPRKEDPSRALDPANLVSLCKPCHSRRESRTRGIGGAPPGAS
jgi:5-methylcytosine-specific restriction enzyme A